jgi:hypothetical protein
MVTVKRAKPSRRPSPARRHAQQQRVSIFGIPFDAGPYGLILRAKMFADAARLIPTPTAGHDWAKWHLVCHALELGLKAFLTLQGSTLEDVFEAYGHKIDLALSDAMSMGLSAAVPLTAHQRKIIRMLATPHAEKVFEYPSIVFVMTDAHSLPSIDATLEIADTLVQQLYGPCQDYS